MISSCDAKFYNFKDKDNIDVEGEEKTHLHFLVNGSVKSSSKTKNYDNMELFGQDKTGNWLGEFWNPNNIEKYKEKSHLCTVGNYAHGDCTTIGFDRLKLIKFILDHPNIQLNA